MSEGQSKLRQAIDRERKLSEARKSGTAFKRKLPALGVLPRVKRTGDTEVMPTRYEDETFEEYYQRVSRG